MSRPTFVPLVVATLREAATHVEGDFARSRLCLRLHVGQHHRSSLWHRIVIGRALGSLACLECAPLARVGIQASFMGPRLGVSAGVMWSHVRLDPHSVVVCSTVPSPGRWHTSMMTPWWVVMSRIVGPPCGLGERALEQVEHGATARHECPAFVL